MDKKEKYVLKIQKTWRLFKAKSYLKIFNKYDLKKQSETISFDDFTKLMLNKELMNITGYLIFYIQYNVKLNLKINNRTLLTAYLFASFPNEILGEENKRDPLSKRIHFYSKHLIDSLVMKDTISTKDQISIIGTNMLNYTVTFSVWKMRDKSEMIQNMILSYYHRGVHIDKIKKGELSTDKHNKSLSIDTLEEQQDELLDSIKLLDKNFDVKFFKENYKTVYETMESDYEKLHSQMKDTMKVAYFDYIKDGMEKGDYQPVLSLIAEVRQRLLNIMMKDEMKKVFEKNVNIEKMNNKIKNNSFERKDIIVSIIHIVESIRGLQAPKDDDSHDEWKNEIVDKFTKESEETFSDIVPEILIQAEERIDSIYADILSLSGKK
jgi:hypothetical protein